MLLKQSQVVHFKHFMTSPCLAEILLFSFSFYSMKSLNTISKNEHQPHNGCILKSNKKAEKILRDSFKI